MPFILLPITSIGEFVLRHLSGDLEINYIFAKQRHPALVTHPQEATSSPVEPGRIIPRDQGGLGWDVWVDVDESRYDARTVIRMVKLVNRRGSVRYFWRNEDKGQVRWFYFVRQAERIAGVDDRLDWVDDNLDAGVLYVSFSDRFEAKRFLADLTALRTITPTKPTEADLATQAEELERRRALMQRYIRNDYPWRPIRQFESGPGEVGDKWIMLVEAKGVSAPALNDWMREHIRGRYWAASWHPGGKAEIVKMAWRYYRLTLAEWNAVIEKARATGCLVIVNFELQEDYATFDRAYGPSQFLHAPPPKRTPLHNCETGFAFDNRD